MSWTRLQPPTPVLDPPLNFDIYTLCVFSEIPGTSPLPWATRRKWLNAGYIVGRISGTRISVDLVQKSYLAITLSSDCVGQQIAELQFRPSTGTISVPNLYVSRNNFWKTWRCPVGAFSCVLSLLNTTLDVKACDGSCAVVWRNCLPHSYRYSSVAETALGGPYRGSLTNLLPVGFWTCVGLKRQWISWPMNN